MAGQRRTRVRVGPLVVVICALVLLNCAIALGVTAPGESEPRRSQEAAGPSAAPPVPSPAPAPSGSTSPAPTGPVTLAFAGDVHFEGGVAGLLDSNRSNLGPLSAALRSADIAMVNLESALTADGEQASKNLEDPDLRYWFRSPPEALDVLQRSGVDVVSLANNHGADYGADGLRDSLRADRSSPVTVLGVGADPAQAYRAYSKTVNGTKVAVLAADASALESRSRIWNVGDGGPGLARADSRLVAAVRQAAATHQIVAVYLHWGDEGESCPTTAQQQLAQRLSQAGADAIVGSHAHLLNGAGMLGSTYVSYGLGNFVWYHGAQSATGVLRLQFRGGTLVRDDFVPGEIPVEGGVPRALGGADRTAAVRNWRELRGCTDLAPGPGEQGASAPAAAPTPTPAAKPAYASAIQAVPDELQRRMIGSSHEVSRCPVRLQDLRLLTMSYVDFTGAPQVGRMIVAQEHAEDVVGVFRKLYEAGFPIRRMQLVDDFGGNDDASMAADNSSAYNCRRVAGSTSLSQHAYGAAVDINPVENPYVTGDGVLPPAGEKFVDMDRSVGAGPTAGVVARGDVVHDAFAAIGWTWGGDWTEADYQHFEAPR